MIRSAIFSGLIAAQRKIGYWTGRGYAGGRTMSAEARAATRFLPRQDAIVIDGGANVGAWTAALLDVAGSRIGRVYAFEPAPEHHPKIRALNDPRVELVGAALGDHCGEVTLYAPQAGSRLASVYRRDLSHYNLSIKEVIKAPGMTIDQFVADRSLRRIDFLKLDIEGHELKALQGAEAAIRSGVVRALSFEFGGCNIDSGSYLRDFWNFLTRHGFRLHVINPLDGVHRIEKYHESLECFVTTNYIASRQTDAQS